MPFAPPPAYPVASVARAHRYRSLAGKIARRAIADYRVGRAPVISKHNWREIERLRVDHYRHPLTLRCVSGAARASRVPRDLILAILWVEGGKVGGVHGNRNGSYDMGPMQVNTLWLPTLRRAGFTRFGLVYNGCANVLAGAMILRFYVNKTGDLVRAVGDYHSSLPQLSAPYLFRISRFLVRYRAGSVASNRVIEMANDDEVE